MSTAVDSPAPQERANGFVTYLSIIATPRAAFEQLSRTPMWGWAAVLGIILTVAATFIMLPEQIHLGHVMQQQQLAQMTADQQAQAGPAMAKFEPYAKFTYIIAALIQPWIGWLIGAVVFLIGAALGGGVPRFRNAWVLAVNAYVISAIAVIVNAILIAMRGPDAVNSPFDVLALPSLAMVVHGGPKLSAFLYSYGIIYIWAYVVTFIGLEQLMKMSRTAALVTTIIFSLLIAGFVMLFAK